jgi:holo-ACP synthase/triphosphoribosyl-dephospho-CoA synthase
LFDYDVFGGDGEKLSRFGVRRCLVCDNDAFVCARSRAHPVGDVVAAANQIICAFFRDEGARVVQAAALRALLSEVAVTPKPGLVDRANNGAHDDMDFFTFIDSAAAVAPFFADCARYGFDHGDDDPPAVLAGLRRAGKIAEIRMKRATAGVNTHQGAIFSLGLVSAAFGRCFRDDEKPGVDAVLAGAAAMVGGGGCGGGGGFGAVAEAGRGFPTVVDFALPVIGGGVDKNSGGDRTGGGDRNGAGVAAFLAILAHAGDANVVRRAGVDALRDLQNDVAGFLAGDPDTAAVVEKARDLDGRCISAHISPGGCADLLAVAFFVDFLCTREVSDG